jgi:hypothetical protein
MPMDSLCAPKRYGGNAGKMLEIAPTIGDAMSANTTAALFCGRLLLNAQGGKRLEKAT